MHIIAHRRNLISELDATPREHGVEIDIRSYGKELVLHHDPFEPGEKFEEWLKHYAHGLLILNVKEEGLETAVLALLKRHSIESFFFLDQSFPFINKVGRGGERRCAVRVSEYEEPSTALKMAKWIDWVWIDCFTKFPLTREQAKELKQANLKLCLVSPELQGRTSVAEISELTDQVRSFDIEWDAVCTKRADLWR